MAATHAVLTLVKAGGRVVVCDNVYGGTHRLFTKILANYGVEFAFIDATDPAAFAAEAARYEMLWLETPTNPMMKICDIRGARRARATAGRDPGRRQHLHEPVLPAAAGARRRHRGALDHQVPERALRQRGRRRDRQGEKHARAGCSTCRTRSARSCRRSTPGSRCAASRRSHMRMPRHEDNACQVAPFLVQPQEGGARAVARLPRPSRAPRPQAPGDRLRRAHLVRPRQPRGGEEGTRRACACARWARAWAASRP